MSNKNGKLKIGNDTFYPSPYWPIHSIYLSLVDTNPSTYFGGTWQLIGQGRTLVGVNTSDSDFNTPRKTGGEKTHTLSVNEMPNHRHELAGYIHREGTGTQYCHNGGAGAWNFIGDLRTTELTGGGQAHNNLQPYLTCYIWERIA